jgi:cation diffusion facilitator family transporter
MPHADSRRVVLAALAGNLAIAASKLVAAILSRSTATLAEAVHSFADSGNQGLLLVGMHLASRPADSRHPFGRASERYFWPFVVALLLFSVGGAFAIFEGVDHLLHPEPPGGNRAWSVGVLGVSLLFEGLSFRVAFSEFRKLAGGHGIARALLEARDPTIPLVLAEDATAMAGLVVALGAVLVSSVTGQAFWDPVGSVVIGALLCAVALLVAWITHGLLIGESAAPADQARALALTEAVPGVERVTQLLTMHLGPDVVVLAMKVAFSPALTVRDVEDVTNRVEIAVREALPQMRKIFVEADSQGDGRGLPPRA